MIFRTATLALAALAVSASPAFAVGKPHNVSWGRAGVSFTTYQADTLDCANRAYGIQVQMRPYGPAGTGYVGSILPAAIWTSLTPGQVPVYTTTYVEGYRHAAWMDTVEQLQAVVDTCLADRGYRQFRLTAGQMRRLNGLAQGSGERAHFLYSLGADQAVLASQAI
jgi:hypothetical protein